ncbi:SH3 domain-containing protein [Brachyspira pulli]|uniref:tetratricopeptide repeat protein n=1 Tax=Brachyspira pulli TaxID=310721 RepID=UPI00300502BA
MKKLLFMLLLFQSYILFGETNLVTDLDQINKLFESANTFYNEGKYLEANNLYKDIISSNFISKDLYYNLASSYASIGSNGYAVLYYEKALNISPFDKEIKSMISSINGNSDYDSALIITMYLLLILFLIFFTILILLFIKNKRINKFLVMVSIVFFIPLIIVSNYVNDDYIVTINNANLYSGSSTKSDIVSQIAEGQKLRVIEEYTNWYYVQGNFKGWINKSVAEKI